jgi:hypothetical protein
MACNNIESISFNCNDSAIGGIEKLFIIDQEDVLSASYSTSTHLVDLTIATSSSFEEIGFRKHVGNYTEDYTKAEDGAIVYTQTVNLPIHGRDADKSRKISILAEGQRYLSLIVKMVNGKYVYFPNMQLQTVGEGSGTLRTDSNKYALSFVGVNESLAFYMTEAEVLSLI